MKSNHPRQPLISGLAALHALQQKSVADGKKIFDFVMQEVADACTLKGIVYQESLLQLILYVTLPLFTALHRLPIMRTSCLAAGPRSSVARTSSG